MARLKVLIVGGGKITEMLLSSDEIKDIFEEVIIIEKEPSRRPVLEMLGDVMVIGVDAAKASAYSNVNLREVNAVLALTDRDEVNLLALSVAKVNEVPIRIGLFSDPETAKIVAKLELGLPIVKQSVITSMLKHMLTSITEARTTTLTSGERLYVVTISETDVAVNLRLGDLKLEEEGARPVLVFQDSELKPATENTILAPGNILFLLAPDESFLRKIRG